VIDEEAEVVLTIDTSTELIGVAPEQNEGPSPRRRMQRTSRFRMYSRIALDSPSNASSVIAL
jgi:hypothetical protein